ncbi:hypothetical protein D7Y41_34005 [Anaerotruncus sp. 1XD22-93]|jgi:hypothetical protein|nr:hypothetical protein [Anaerotruncus sp. 1XD42-93]RKJ74968.1 hypothetical protein D7Y41_34005 [Anaerotruncus sp. 1XD22-93]
MIVEFFCNLFFSLLHFLINLFPKFPSFNGLNVSLSPLLYVVRFINMFVSFAVVSRCLLIILIVYNLKFVWSIIMWLIRKIPGVS